MEEIVIWTFQEEQRLREGIVLGKLYERDNTEFTLCAVVESFVADDILLASRECPDTLFFNPIGVLPDGRLVFPTFKKTLKICLQDQFQCFRDYFNGDVSFSPKFIKIIRCCLEAIMWVHSHQRYHGNLNLNSIIVDDKCTKARVAVCEWKSCNSTATLVRRQIGELNRFIKMLNEYIWSHFEYKFEVHSEVLDFLNVDVLRTCEQLLEHPALWSYDERRAKVLSALDMPRSKLSKAQLAQANWTDLFKEDIRKKLCGKKEWKYKNTIFHLLKLFRNQLMHSKDNEWKEVNNHFRSFGQNLNATLEEYNNVPPLIILRAILPEFYMNLNRFLSSGEQASTSTMKVNPKGEGKV